MAADTSVSYTGTVDVGAIFTNIARGMPDSPLVKDFFTQIAQPLVEQIKGAKIKGLNLDFSKIFGIDSRLGKSTKAAFTKATERLLKSVERQVSKVNKMEIKGELDLNNIIGSTQTFRRQTKARYERVIDRYLERVAERLKTANVQLAKVDLRDLLGSTPIFRRNVRLKYQKTVRSILSSLEHGAAHLNLSGTVDVSTLIGGTPTYTRNIRTEYRKLISGVFQNLSNQLGKVSFSSEGLTLSQLIGATPRLLAWSRFHYETLVKDVLKKIKSQLSSLATPLIQSDKISVRELIGATPQFGKWSNMTYQSLVRRLLRTLKTEANKITFVSAGIKISDLIGATPQFSAFTNFQYQRTVREVLRKLSDVAKVTAIGKIDFSSLLGRTPEFSFFTRQKYQRVIRALLDRIETVLQKRNLLGKTFNISQIIGQTPAFNRTTASRYQKIIAKLLDYIEKEIGNIKFDSFNLTNLFNITDLTKWSNTGIKKALTKLFDKIEKIDIGGIKLSDILKGLQGLVPVRTFQSDLDEPPEIIVTDFSDTALRKLHSLFKGDYKEEPISERKSIMKAKEEKGEKGESTGGFLEKYLGMEALKKLLPEIGKFFVSSAFLAGLGYVSLTAMLAGVGWLMYEMQKQEPEWGNTKEDIELRQKREDDLKKQGVSPEIAKKVVQNKEFQEHAEDPNTSPERKQGLKLANRIFEDQVKRGAIELPSKQIPEVKSKDQLETEALKEFFSTFKSNPLNVIKLPEYTAPKDIPAPLVQPPVVNVDNSNLVEIQEKQIKHLEILTFSVNQLLTQLDGAGKNLSMIADNSKSFSSLNSSSVKMGNTSPPNPINTNVRDPAFEQRQRSWDRLRGH